jgi:tRNA dimethylallyltransferase
MVEEGLLEEAKYFYDKDIKTKPLMGGIGYKELYDYFDNKVSLQDALEKIKQNSRRYAKRQITWFSSKDYVHKVFVDDENGLKTFENIVNISKKLF